MTWDDYPQTHLKRDELGQPVATPQGQEVYTFPGAIRPAWPEADFIVGNGGKYLRGRLRAGYAKALWKVHPHINPSADFVMYWWVRAAELLTRKGTRLRRFGFVTTNSITQVFQRRVIERHLCAASPVSLLLAIPDHPWTKSGKDAAAVRFAITVVAAGETAEHRVLQFLDAGILPDNMLVAVASDAPFHLGVLSSKIHAAWASLAGGTLEDRPRYSKSRCFDPFSFPDEPASRPH